MNWKKINSRKKEDITDPVGWEFPNGAQGQIGTGYDANKGDPCFIVIYQGPYRDQRFYVRFEDIAAEFWRQNQAILES